MVQRCFRHQHPEAYGRPEVAEAAVPQEVRYGRDSVGTQGELVTEEPMGHPGAVVLD
jgi:hypothetical protein